MGRMRIRHFRQNGPFLAGDKNTVYQKHGSCLPEFMVPSRACVTDQGLERGRLPHCPPQKAPCFLKGRPLEAQKDARAEDSVTRWVLENSACRSVSRKHVIPFSAQ